MAAQERAGQTLLALVVGLSCKRPVLSEAHRGGRGPSCILFSALAPPWQVPIHGPARLGGLLQPMTRTDCASPQSPKGFLESYEEMLTYALRPETWATTRLELEGRGVSLLVLVPEALSRAGYLCRAPPSFQGSEMAPSVLRAPSVCSVLGQAVRGTAPAAPHCRAGRGLLTHEAHTCPCPVWASLTQPASRRWCA